MFKKKYIASNPDKPSGKIINESDYSTIFQDSRIEISTEEGYPPIYYSIQQNKGYQAITVIVMNNWVIEVCLLIYNKKGKLISYAYLYEYGGDESFSVDSWGEYINDSTYLKTKSENEMDEDNNKYYCDSTTSLIQINYKGAITTRELSNKRFYKK